MEPDAYTRLDALERSNRQLRTLLLVSILVLPLLAALAFTSFGGLQRNNPIVADSLFVRQLVVIDSQGIVRARLGAHLPDPVIDGRRLRRGADIAGILLYDDTGRERGGYVTFSPSRLVALTLDTRDRQVALFAADSDDGVAARVWGGTNWVELRASTKGAHLNIGRSNELVLQQPPVTNTEISAYCAGLNEAVRQISPPPSADQVLAECRLRMPDAACRKCIRRR
jgi:hypothetical protein